MQLFDSICELRNGTRDSTARTNTKSENYGSEDTSAMDSHETDENEEHGIGTITQEEVKEQFKSFIFPLKNQLEDLTRFVQGASESLPKGEYR